MYYDSALQRLARMRVKSIGRCRVHRSPPKKCKSRHLLRGSMRPENWVRIARTVFSLDTRNRVQADRKRYQDANLSPPPEEISGVRRNSNAKVYKFSPLYSSDFGLHYATTYYLQPTTHQLKRTTYHLQPIFVAGTAVAIRFCEKERLEISDIVP